MITPPTAPSGSAKHHVIGTAGHIDHGKTTLVKALTGIDTDRLKEEKERGITIELGFAHLALPGSGTVGVLDVPGHERFVRTMVAGAVGIDLVLLVVAADEGVMPQTREHLDICGLLGIRRGVVALTKWDLLHDDAELRELAVADVRQALAGSFLADAPIVPCSSTSGAGLDHLKREIDALLLTAPGHDPGGLVRLPIDRVFTMKGFGTVATGTLWAGEIRVGDDLVALPGGEAGKVRGLEVHGEKVQRARCGQRTAVNLGVPRTALARGQTLVAPRSAIAGHILDARLRYLPWNRAPLGRRARLLFHAATAQRMALIHLLDREELLPGESALAQIHLDQPMVLLPGDRFILRGFTISRQHGSTVGGGLVLRVLSARHRRGTPRLVETLGAIEAALPARGDPEGGDAITLVAQEIARAGVRGAGPRDLRTRLPLSEPAIWRALQALLTAKRVIATADGDARTYVSAEALALVTEEILRQLAAFHDAQPLLRGVPREALRMKILPMGGDRAGVGEGPPAPLDAPLFFRALESLSRTGRIVVERDVISLHGHDPQARQAEAGLDQVAERVHDLHRQAGLAPPRPEEAAQALGVDLERVRLAIEVLVRRGDLVRVKDLCFERRALGGLRERLIAYLKEHHEITPAAFKDLTGQTRKFAIPLAEHFDAEKVTLRIGDVRRLRSLDSGPGSGIHEPRG